MIKYLSLGFLSFFLLWSPAVLAADQTTYTFHDEGFSIALPHTWTPDDPLDESLALRRWSSVNGAGIEIYAYRAISNISVRKFVAEQDRITKEKCNGKPVLTVKYAEWIRMDGLLALLRHEHSCMTNSDFIHTYVRTKGHHGEFSTWMKNPVLTKPDIEAHKALLKGFHFVD